MSFSTMLAKMVMKLPNSWLVKMSGGHPVQLGGRTLDPHLPV
ncbi:MAG TPA: alpha/beta hydrolase, partial [Hyphomonadaceae bacterium]|nr:alpha/beta hydrolase [Hyphomonadaceae bacterium]